MLQALLDVPVVIPVTLLAMGVCGLGALLRPRTDSGIVLGLLAAVWSRVNTPVEGRILHTWTPGRGFTEADVLSVMALMVAVVTLGRCGWRLARHVSRPRAEGPEEPLAAR